MKIAAVVPTCRGFSIPKQTIPVDWYVVHDRQAWPCEGQRTDIITPDATMYGKRCDSIRSAGFLAAYKAGADVILTVDDDCLIPANWAEQHVHEITKPIPYWSSTMRLRPRGLPYNVDDTTYIKCALTHGLWNGMPDLDGRTQQVLGQVNMWHADCWERVYPPFPQSAMNFGFIKDVIHVMYQPAQGEGTPFDRFADIWGGLLAQRALTLHDWGFKNGGAHVYHSRASDVASNVIKEAPGMEEHESFWKYVWSFNDKGTTLVNTYCKLANHVAAYPSKQHATYFAQLKENMFNWVNETTT